MEAQRKLDDIAEWERLSAENRGALEAARRDADIDRAERLREKEAELVSQERIERSLGRSEFEDSARKASFRFVTQVQSGNT